MCGSREAPPSSTQVRPVSDFGDPMPLPAGVADAVSAIDGVADAVPSIEAVADAIRPLTAVGDAITTGGPPHLAFNWIENEELSPFSLVQGSPPAVGEFVIDRDSAADHGFVIGNSYELLTPGGRAELTLSGTSSFGEDNATLGAVLMQMSTAQAGELFAIDGISTSAICSPTWGPDRRAASGPTTIWRAEPPHPGGRGLTDGDGPQAGGR